MIADFWEECGIIEIEGTGKQADFSADYWEKWFFEVVEKFGVVYANDVKNQMMESDSYLVPFTCTVEYSYLLNHDTKLPEQAKREALFLADHTLEEYIEKFFN